MFIQIINIIHSASQSKIFYLDGNIGSFTILFIILLALIYPILSYLSRTVYPIVCILFYFTFFLVSLLLFLLLLLLSFSSFFCFSFRSIYRIIPQYIIPFEPLINIMSSNELFYYKIICTIDRIELNTQRIKSICGIQVIYVKYSKYIVIVQKS